MKSERERDRRLAPQGLVVTVGGFALDKHRRSTGEFKARNNMIKFSF